MRAEWREAPELKNDVSCRRGMGPSKSTQGLPLERLHQLPEGTLPWCEGGPIVPKHVLVIGTWFLLREIEVSTVRAEHCKVRRQDGELTVTLLLAGSKQTTPG